jgi:hypothetical protein
MQSKFTKKTRARRLSGAVNLILDKGTWSFARVGLSKLEYGQQLATGKLVFGNQAIVAMPRMAEDPWRCVPGFHRVCLYRYNRFEGAALQKERA